MFDLLQGWSSAPALVLASRIFGALLFASAAMAKLRHFEEFVGLVARYRLVPFSAARAAAILVVALETLTAASLLSGLLAHYGAMLAIALLTAFAVAMLVAWLRGERELDCGCFQSALRQHVSPALLIRNVLLIVLLLPALAIAPAFSAGHWIDGLGAGVALFILSQVLNELLAVQTRRQASAKGAL